MWNIIFLAAIKVPDSLPKTDATGSKIQAILQILFGLMGSTALLMVGFGAFKYVISQGEATAVRSAKNTILYAVVGLVVALAAWSIVTFVLKGVLS